MKLIQLKVNGARRWRSMVALAILVAGWCPCGLSAEAAADGRKIITVAGSEVRLSVEEMQKGGATVYVTNRTGLERTGDSMVEESVTAIIEEGVRKAVTNRVVVLQPGGSYRDSNGVWRAATTNVELTATGARYREGAVQALFPGDPAAGPIEYVLPEGERIKIHTLGLAITDRRTHESVWVAELRSGSGILDGSTITYTNVFSGTRSDLRVSLGTIGRIQSDIVLRERPIDLATIEALGMKLEDCDLEAWHWVAENPEGTTHAGRIQRTDGRNDIDEQLRFGTAMFGNGTAFLLGQGGIDQSRTEENGGSMAVAKEVFQADEASGGRLYLIERIPLSGAWEALSQLPAKQQAALDREILKKRLEEAQEKKMASGRGRGNLKGNAERRNPVRLATRDEPTPARRPGAEQGIKRVAALTRGKVVEERGYLVDYTIISTAQANYRFKGSETYYINADISFTGATVAEAGTVIKMGSGTTPKVQILGTLECLSTPLSPITITAKDDNSIGQNISGSSGTPSGEYGDYHIYIPESNTNAITVHDLRSRYARNGLGFFGTGPTNVGHNLQILSANNAAILGNGNTVTLRNVLIEKSVAALQPAKTNTTFRVENLTAHRIGKIVNTNGFGGTSVSITNSLLVIVSNSVPGVTMDSYTQTLTSESGVFETVRAGAHYLAPKSPYRLGGSSNPTAEMLALMKAGSTYAPLELTNTITTNTRLDRRVPRGDNDGPKALGFFYPAVDYVATALTVTNATLTLTNGVVVAGYGPKTFKLSGTGTIVSEGRPNRVNGIVTIDSVQEQPVRYITNTFYFVDGYKITLKNTEVSAVASSTGSRQLNGGSFYTGTVTVKDSLLRNLDWNVQNFQSSGGYPEILLQNSILERCSMRWEQGYDIYEPGNLAITCQDNLFTRSTFYLIHWGNNFGAFQVYDNLFDNCTLGWGENDPMPPQYGGPMTDVKCNGYSGASAAFGGSSNKVSVAVSFVNGPLGRFYHATTGTMTNLVDAGTLSAVARGLFHFTTVATAGSFDGNTRLDIGHHYAAATTGGKLEDSDGDGLSNLSEDVDNDGLADAGETSWADADTDRDGIPDGDEKAMNMDPLNVGEQQKRRLGYWAFRETDFKADTGQADVGHPYVVLTPSISGYAARMTNSSAGLQYREVEMPIGFSLSRERGTVRFWFHPEWNTAATNIFDPANPGQLLALGAPSAGKDNWWSLHFSPKGDQLQFESQANATGRTNAPITINWKSTNWYQVTCTYDTNFFRLYVNGLLAGTNSAGPLTPAYFLRQVEKLSIGSYGGGSGVALGDFDEIETFNYAMSQAEVEAGYPGPSLEDADHDDLPTILELTLGLNAFDADTDNDGIPDGYEYYSAQMAPTNWTGPLLSATTQADGTNNWDGDQIVNRLEFLYGSNPYVSNGLAKANLPDQAQAPTNLWNLDMGGTLEYLGRAGAGYATNDYWNRARANSTGFGLWDATGTLTTNAPQIRFYYNLGTMVKNRLACDDTPPATSGPAGDSSDNPVCRGLQLTNLFGFKECCMPTEDVPVGLVWQTTDALYRAMYDYLNQNASGLYGYRPSLHQWWINTDRFHFSGEPPILSPTLPTNICVSSVGYLNYVPSGALVKDATVASETSPVLGLWDNERRFRVASEEMYNFFWGAPPGLQTPRPTASPEFIFGPNHFGERAPIRPVAVNMALGWSQGFSREGGVSGITSGVGTNSFMQRYLDSLFDEQKVNLPSGDACNTYQYNRDGHAEIRIGPVSGYYRVYLYATKNGESQPTMAMVNDNVVRIPPVRNGQTTFMRGLNFAGATVSGGQGWAAYNPDAAGTAAAYSVWNESIVISFPQDGGYLNALQLMKLEKLSAPTNIKVRADHVYGGVVQWDPVPTATHYWVRRTTVGTGTTEVFWSDNCAFNDPWIPRTNQVTYAVQAENEVPALVSDWSGEQTVNALGLVAHNNNAPIIGKPIQLAGAYQNTPFSIGAATIWANSDAQDIDGDNIEFCISELGAGTLKRVQTDGTVTTITAADLTSTNLLTIGRDATLIWEPPSAASEISLPAFYVRAFDGQALSTGTTPVMIHIKGPTVLMWWGDVTHSITGSGEPPWTEGTRFPGDASVRLSALEFWNGSKSFMAGPSPVRAYSTNEGTFSLTNVVQVAGESMTSRIFLRADGTVWTLGKGNFGELGDQKVYFPNGDTNQPGWFTREELKAIQVIAISNAVSVSSGIEFKLAAKADGTVWGWGRTEAGQLGSEQGRNYGRFGNGGATSVPTAIQGLENIVAVESASAGSLALSADGKVYFWGSWAAWRGIPHYEVLHEESTRTPILQEIPGKVIKIAASGSGWDSFFAITSAGQLYVWGQNQVGELGYSPTNGLGYVQAPTLSTLTGVADVSSAWGKTTIVLRTGETYQCGWEVGFVPRKVGGLQDIVAPRVGGFADYALDRWGRVFGWGSDTKGALGGNSTVEYTSPILLDFLGPVDNIWAPPGNQYVTVRVEWVFPKGLQTVSKDRLVELSWRTYPNAVTYELQRGFNTNVLQTIAVVPNIESQSKQRYADASVTNGVHYYYRVRALEQNGASAFSPAVQAVPSGPPGAVASITAVALSRQNQVSWSRAPRANAYQLFRSENGGAFQLYSDVQDGALAFGGNQSDPESVLVVDSELTIGKTYAYKVQATNLSGFGPVSSASATITAVTTPGLAAPTGVAVDIASNGKASVTWDAVDGLVGTYWVRAYEMNGTNRVRMIAPTQVRSVPNAQFNVMPGRTNLYLVSIVTDEGGESDPASVTKAYWPPYTATPPIEFLEVKAGAGFVYLRWSGAAVSYGVQVTPSTNVECSYFTVEPDRRNKVAEFYAANLPAGTYTVAISQNFNSTSTTNAATNILTVASLGTNPMKPLRVRPGNNQARITWWGEDDEFPASETAFKDWRFILQRKEDAEPAPYCPGWWTIFESKDLGVVDPEVLNGHQYRYRLYGISPSSDVYLQTNATQYVPFATFGSATALAVSVAEQNGGVMLSWSGTTNISGIRVEAADVPGGPYTKLADLAASALSFEHRGLVNGWPHYYLVTLTNVNGDFLPSGEVMGMPREGGPLFAPSNFSADLQTGLVYLSWEPVPGADSYGALRTNGVWKTLVNPETVTDYASTNAQYHFWISATRRSQSSTQAVTVETIKWTAIAGATKYNVATIAGGATNLVGQTISTNYEHPRLGIFTNLGHYLITALNDVGTSLGTTTSISARDAVTWNATATNITTIQLLDLSSDTNNPTAITSPTNLTLRIAIANSSEDQNWVERVDYFSDGAYIGTARDYPYSFQWVNPPGSFSGTTHAVKARLITAEGTYAETALKYARVTVRPEFSAFTTAATDLQIPAPGLPLSLGRYYDSRDTKVGWLGKGWKLDWERNYIYMADPSPGWRPVPFDSFGRTTFTETQDHPIEVHVGGGKEVFAPQADRSLPASFEVDQNSDGYFFKMRFAGVAGALGRLAEDADVADVRAGYESGIQDLYREANPFTPTCLTYTSSDRSAFRFESEPAQDGKGFYTLSLKAVADTYGNTITLDNTVATNLWFNHSNGRRLRMGLSVAGVVNTWSVFDPAELAQGTPVPVLKYVVSNLFLTEVHAIKERATPSYDVTYYTYDASGRLAQAVRPDGVVSLWNRYDASSFLTNQADAIGLESTLGFGSGGGGAGQTQVSQNVGGATSQVTYGPGGEVLTVQADTGDANTVASIGYNERGLPAYQKQANGGYATFEYDRSGRMTGTVDALGNRVSTIYNPLTGGPASAVDALGNGTAYEYYREAEATSTDMNTVVNPAGALRLMVDATGLQTLYAYNFRGQPLSETKVALEGGAPQVTRYEYFANGDLKATRQLAYRNGSDEVYVTNSFAYDLNGNRLSETRVRHVLYRDGAGATHPETIGGIDYPKLTNQVVVSGFTYDARNRLVVATNPLGETSSSTFDANGKVILSVNTFGQVTTNLYDVRGNLIQTAYPDGTVSRSVFDERGRVIWSQERAAADTNNVTVAPATETQYDALGRAHLVYRHENTAIQKAALASTNETASFTLGAYYRKLTGITGTNQYTLSVTATGTVASVTRTDYDSNGRVKYSVNALGGVTAFEYDVLGRRTNTITYLAYALTNIATQTISPGTNTFVTTKSGYDGNGNQIWSIDGNTNRTDFYYDEANRRWLTQFPLVSGEGERKAQWSVFDGFGQEVAKVDGLGVWTAYQRDLLGRLITVTNDYRTIYTGLQRPMVTRYAYDEFGNMTNEVKVAYEANTNGFGQLVVDAAQTAVTWFEADKLGRRTYRFLPTAANLNDSSGNAGMEKTTWSRMTNGSGVVTLRKAVRDFRNITITSDYDKMDRLATNALPAVNAFESARTRVFSYSGPLLTRVTETGGIHDRTSYYAYDDSRRLRKKDTPEAVLTYTYATGGQIGTINVWRRAQVGDNAEPDGSSTNNFKLTYDYDALSRMYRVTSTVNATNWATTYTFDAGGNIDQVTSPAAIHDYNYNARNQLIDLVLKKVTNGTILKKYAYELDPTGRRKSVTEYTNESGSYVAQRTVQYGYDKSLESGHPDLVPKLYRLGHEEIYDNSGYLTGTVSHAYGPRGNRSSRDSDVGPVADTTWAYTIDDRIHTTSGATNVWDANGNWLGLGGVTNYFDAENRLIKQTTGSSTNIVCYDHDGNRVWKLSLTNLTGWTNWSREVWVNDDKNPTGYVQPIAMYWQPNSTNANTWAPTSWAFHNARDYGYGLLGMWQATNKFYFGLDGHGSVRMLLANSGSVATNASGSPYSYDYDAGGNLLNSPPTVVMSNFRFAGELWDPELKVYYNRARYFDPNQGRFWSSDSYEGSLSDPMSLHKYLYCVADPVNHIDPSGHEIEYDAGKGIQAHALFFTYCQTRGIPKYFDQPISVAYPSMLGEEGARLRPDVNDVRSGKRRWFELKPITHRNSEHLWASTEIQLAGYTEALAKFGVPPGNQRDLVPVKTPIGTVFDRNGREYLCTLYAASEDRPGLVYYALSSYEEDDDVCQYLLIAIPSASHAVVRTAGRIAISARTVGSALRVLSVGISARASLGAVTKL